MMLQDLASQDLFVGDPFYDAINDMLGGRHIESVTFDSRHPDKYNLFIDIDENFLWDRDTQEAQDARAEELDDNFEIVQDVFHEWYGVNVEPPEGWHSVRIEFSFFNLPVLEFEKSITTVLNALEKYTNETDPGTFGSPYVMAEVDRRIEKKKEGQQ